MPRVLVTQGFARDASARAAFLSAARARLAQARDAGCNLWLFESENGSEYVQFIEGPDVSTLRTALRAVAAGDDLPIMREVDLR